jgi:SAM-dependent methyltransferase
MSHEHSFLRIIRQIFSFLRQTPVHPQWLIFRSESETIKSVAEHLHGIVLDIGCGNRWVERALPANSIYVGLDYPSTAQLGYRDRPTVYGNGQQLPFADNSFDCVAMMDVLEHMPEPGRALVESWRVLKPQGTILIQVPFLYPLHDEPYDFQRWCEEGLRHLCDISGFEIQLLKSREPPITTAASLLAIALAKSALDAITNKHITLLLTPLIIILIPIVNILGWLAGQILPDSNMMPSSYTVLARKNS